MSLKFVLLVPIVLALILIASVHFLWVLTFVISKIFHFTVSYSPWKWTSIGLVLLAWLVMAYGYFVGKFRLDVNRVEYVNSSIPSSFDGYRIVHISDIHLSTFDGHPEVLKRFVDSVNAQNPDLICFTGDLVTIGVDEASPFTSILKTLHAKDGVMAVLGNHDFLIYRRDYASQMSRMAAVEELCRYERDILGWTLLRNQHHSIVRGGDTLDILGVDNQSCKGQGFHTVSFGVLHKAMYGSDGFRVLLSHDPTHWSGEVLPDTDIPLTLSGHTHDAQLRFFGFSPASWMFREHAGWYQSHEKGKHQSLYVNVGWGCTLPLRIGVNAEITVIDFKRE